MIYYTINMSPGLMCYIYAQIQRIPPLESSMIALKTLLGQDESISVEELLDRKLKNSI